MPMAKFTGSSIMTTMLVALAAVFTLPALATLWSSIAEATDSFLLYDSEHLEKLQSKKHLCLVEPTWHSQKINEKSYFNILVSVSLLSLRFSTHLKKLHLH